MNILKRIKNHYKYAKLMEKKRREKEALYEAWIEEHYQLDGNVLSVKKKYIKNEKENKTA